MAPEYGGYLRLPTLLETQRPATTVHDERLFITVHQAYELWFKQILFELGDSRDLMLAGDADLACERLERCHAIERVLVAQFDVLDTMPPQEFAAFRGALGTGNGGQSAQFWEIAYLSGAKDPAHLDRPWHDAAERDRLRRRYDEPSVWDGFLAILAASGFDTTTAAARATAFARIARDRRAHRSSWRLAEALLAHDQSWALWQSRHLLTVQRQIGAKPGTGRTAGASYLLQHRIWFFPELWALRTQL